MPAYTSYDLPPRLPLDPITKVEVEGASAGGADHDGRGAAEARRGRGASFQYSRALREARAAVLTGKLAPYLGGKENSTNSAISPLPPHPPSLMGGGAWPGAHMKFRRRPSSASSGRAELPMDSKALTARSMLVSPRPSSAARERAAGGAPPPSSSITLNRLASGARLASNASSSSSSASSRTPSSSSASSRSQQQQQHNSNSQLQHYHLLPPARDATPSPPHSASQPASADHPASHRKQVASLIPGGVGAASMGHVMMPHMRRRHVIAGEARSTLRQWGRPHGAQNLVARLDDVVAGSDLVRRGLRGRGMEFDEVRRGERDEEGEGEGEEDEDEEEDEEGEEEDEEGEEDEEVCDGDEGGIEGEMVEEEEVGEQVGSRHLNAAGEDEGGIMMRPAISTMAPSIPKIGKSLATERVGEQLLPPQQEEARCEPGFEVLTNGLPKVTCKAWCVFDCDVGDVTGGVKVDTKLPPASLTKVMTAHIVLKLSAIDPSLLSEQVRVTERAAAVIGTSAQLKKSETLTVLDALYGLMLPSGNDAATALAEHFGRRLYARRVIRKARAAAKRAKRKCAEAKLESTGHTREEAATAYLKKIKKREFDPRSAFVAEMNREAAAMGLGATHFSNPHGMHAKNHHSTARDVSRLCRIVMEASPLFRKIVATTEHSCMVGIPGGAFRAAKWVNTNVLLNEPGYEGVKTGNTPMAKFCLATQYRDPATSRLIITVVLGSKNKEKRSADTRAVVKWEMARGNPKS